QDLVAQGLIQKDSRNAPYTLTEQGEALRPAVYELIRWSYLNNLGTQPEESPNPRWDLLTLQALQRSDPPKRFHKTINLTLETVPFHLVAKTGQLSIALEHSAVSAAHVQASHAAFRQYCQNKEVELAAELHVEGEQKAALTVLRLFQMPHSIR
ncbi:MAG: hypothetical protein AAGB04_28240, partial [Pseudomonadota bacterium]